MAVSRYLGGGTKSMIEKETLRLHLERSLGRDELRKFLLCLHSASLQQARLTYWQELKIESISRGLGIATLSFEEVASLFNYCYLHKDELREDDVPIVYGTRAPEAAEAVAHALNTYPYANVEMFGPCWVEGKTHSKVLFCLSCREAWFRSPEARRQAEHRAECLADQASRRQQQIELSHRVGRRQIALCVTTGMGLGAIAAHFSAVGLVLGAACGGLGGFAIGLAAASHAMKRTLEP